MPTGAWYDGWETRRHNPEPSDWVVVRLGAASGVILGFEVDTAHFSGNEAPAVSVDAAYSPTSDTELVWEEVLPKQPCGPSARHLFKLPRSSKPFSHVRLHMYPDGGIARFRVYGMPVVDFSQIKIGTTIDLASVFYGGVPVAVSDQHYSTAANLLLPGRGIDMGDGWETRRSRQPGHEDWAIIKLGAPTTRITSVVVDTANFIGNAPKYVHVKATSSASSALAPPPDCVWVDVVPQTTVKPDFENVFEVSVSAPATHPYTHVRLAMVPDGGIKRIRVMAQATID